MTYTLLINKIYNFLLLRTTMQLSYKCTSNCPKNSKNKSNILIVINGVCAYTVIGFFLSSPYMYMNQVAENLQNNRR